MDNTSILHYHFYVNPFLKAGLLLGTAYFQMVVLPLLLKPRILTPLPQLDLSYKATHRTVQHIIEGSCVCLTMTTLVEHCHCWSKSLQVQTCYCRVFISIMCRMFIHARTL